MITATRTPVRAAAGRAGLTLPSRTKDREGFRKLISQGRPPSWWAWSDSDLRRPSRHRFNDGTVTFWNFYFLHAASHLRRSRCPFLDIALWVVLPYVSFAILIVGLAWRYKTDQYGWTRLVPRSGMNDHPALNSPLFHFGVLFAFLGHVLGLVIPNLDRGAASVPQRLPPDGDDPRHDRRNRDDRWPRAADLPSVVVKSVLVATTRTSSPT